MKGWKGAERMGLKEKLEKRMGIGIAEATNETVYYGLLSLVKELCKEKEENKGKKKIYYIFLCKNFAP